MDIDAIDSLLGEPATPPRRRPPALGAPEPMPLASGPIVPSPPPSVPPPISAPRGGDTRFDALSSFGDTPTPTLTREPSASPDVVDVGARGGAHTTEPPPPTSPPPPPAPPSAPDAGTGVTAPDAADAGTSGATNPQDAYNNLVGSIDPNASQADMEAAIDAAYRNVPGYEGAYKESVKINGKWYDLVGGYGGPNASFHGMMGKTGGTAGAFSAGLFPEGGGVPQIDNTSRLDQILASIDAMARGEGSPLIKQSIDELLGGGGAVATPESVTPFVDQSAPPAARRVRGVR